MEWMNSEGMCLESTKGVATRQQGEVGYRRCQTELMDWTENEEEEEWDLSDYRLIWGTYKARVDKDVVRKVVDRERLKGITKGLEEGGCQRRG